MSQPHVPAARALAHHYLSTLGDRWAHVSAAGARAEHIHRLGLIDQDLVIAAWLHDIGYSPSIATTGFHPLDGATYLLQQGVPVRIVAMVAAHTGAEYEAEERSLTKEWSSLPRPDPDDLDIITMIDLVTGPTGQPTTPHERLREVLRRYPNEHPVHCSITRSSPVLLQSAKRAQQRLQLPGNWSQHL